MSAHSPCKCPKELRHWFVWKRNYNNSTFHGGYQDSDYSSVSCRTCEGVWRTKAQYVDNLPDGQLV